MTIEQTPARLGQPWYLLLSLSSFWSPHISRVGDIHWVVGRNTQKKKIPNVLFLTDSLLQSFRIIRRALDFRTCVFMQLNKSNHCPGYKGAIFQISYFQIIESISITKNSKYIYCYYLVYSFIYLYLAAYASISKGNTKFMTTKKQQARCNNTDIAIQIRDGRNKNK